MSGGHFDYKNYNIAMIADQIEELVANNDSNELNEWGDVVGSHFSSQTVEELKKAITILKLAAVYTQRIDYLISGDDSENSFHKRLAEDLAKLSG